MDPFDLLTQDDLLNFLHYNKTEMSCMDEPLLFLNHLRDNHLVPEDLYTKVVRMETKEERRIGVYEVLDTLERSQPDCVKIFWRCVFTNHIMQLYPTLRLLQYRLIPGFPFSKKMDNMGKRKDAEGENEELKVKKVELGFQEKQSSQTSKRMNTELKQEVKMEMSSPQSSQTSKRMNTELKQEVKMEMSSQKKQSSQTSKRMNTELKQEVKMEMSSQKKQSSQTSKRMNTELKQVKMKMSSRKKQSSQTSKRMSTELKQVKMKMSSRKKQSCQTSKRRSTELKQVKMKMSSRKKQSCQTSKRMNTELKQVKKEMSSQKKQSSQTSKRRSGKVTQEEEEDEDEATQAIPSIKKKKQQTSTKCSTLTKKGRKDIWPKYKLPVTCGDKEGFLHSDKLARGEQCIVHQDRWYTPSEFEKLGGKERMKKWKKSIRCRNTTLQKLIEEGTLKCPSAIKRTSDSGQRRKVRFSSRPHTSTTMFDDLSSEEETSSSSQEEDSSEGDQIDEGKEETMMAEAEGAVRGDSYPSMFEGSSLPVQCGSVTGRLQKYRFASGSKGKCIHTEDSWLTPEELWKKDITCRGQPLSYLLQKKILHSHSVLCNCNLCNHSTLEDQRNDDECFICGEEKEDLVCCDGCPRSFHEDCHLPTPTTEDYWLCTFCVWKKKKDTDHMTLQQVLDSRISDYKLRCQYLLLVLLNADKQKTFTTYPCHPELVSGYSSVVPRPMWLQKVRENLESRYTLVGEFVSDIRLIFRNCAIFNRNNLVMEQLGLQLSDLFEKEFSITFNISTNTIHQQGGSKGKGKKGLIKVKEEREEQHCKSSRVPHNTSPLSSPPFGSGRTCESCAEVPDSSHWVVVKPEVSTEKTITTYSLSSPAGSYECSESGLRWSCAAPVTLQYRFRKEELFWTQLQMLQYQPAGPLMDIELLSGKLEEIHPPHSLCLGDSDPSVLENAVRALHSDDSDTGVSLETCKLTRFHARIPVGHFSMWQVVVSLGIPVRSHCEVLIYQYRPQPLILHTFLVPTPSTVRQAVEKKWRRPDIRSISKPPPNDSLLVNSKFQLCIFGSSSEIIPSEVTLSYKTPPTYFEVCLEKPPTDFKMELSPAGENQAVWKAVMRQGADYHLTEDQAHPRKALDSQTDAETFVDKHRPELIQRVTCVMPIADVLVSKGLLNHEKYSEIEVAATNQDKMRKIYDCLNSAGAKGKAAFYDALKQKEPHLVENLTELLT